jgi:hypothetical protein
MYQQIACNLLYMNRLRAFWLIAGQEIATDVSHCPQFAIQNAWRGPIVR